MKLGGSSYMDVHRAGGGIHYTVGQTRTASEEELLSSLLKRLDVALQNGTTLLEAKSGYGLDTETELKMLRVLEKAKQKSKVEISSTFCGAHAVPKNMTAEEATEAVLTKQLPALEQAMAKGEMKVENIDVFCEKDVFDLHQTREILQAGRRLGLRMNFHGDELHPMNAAEMGAEIGAEAISHLEEISQNGIEAMSRAGTIAVLLPSTAHVLRLYRPPARRMMHENVAIALGSDFNPNAFCLSMPLVMNLACVLCYMTLEEALVAATLNAAAVLGRSRTHGSIERRKVADLLLINAPRWEHLIYQMGAQSSLIHTVIKKGEVVYRNDNTVNLI